MPVINAAAGTPPGHAPDEGCGCRPRVLVGGLSTIVIHHVASSELVREAGGLSDAKYSVNAEARCSRQGCGHPRAQHWWDPLTGKSISVQQMQRRDAGACTYAACTCRGYTATAAS